MQWTRSNAVYSVSDVAVSIEWYRRVLGFEPLVVNPPGDEVPVYAVLYKDSVSIHLMRKDEAPYGLTGPMQTRFWVDAGLDELFQQVGSLGVTVLQSPGDRPWGQRDFMIADPDQNVIWVTMPLPEDAI
jgi:uncharacterized glyoxalase superfamily protein PhnB